MTYLSIYHFQQDMLNCYLFFLAYLLQPTAIRILLILSTNPINHYNIGNTSFPNYTTNLTAIGYLLNLFTSDKYRNLRECPWFLNSCISFSVGRMYLTWSRFYISIECVYGTAGAFALNGLYSLHKHLISGQSFLVIILMFFFLITARVMGTGLSFLIGTSMTTQSFRWISHQLQKKDTTCCLGTIYIMIIHTAQATIKNRVQGLPLAYDFMMLGDQIMRSGVQWVKCLARNGDIC